VDLNFKSSRRRADIYYTYIMYVPESNEIKNEKNKNDKTYSIFFSKYTFHSTHTHTHTHKRAQNTHTYYITWPCSRVLVNFFFLKTLQHYIYTLHVDMYTFLGLKAHESPYYDLFFNIHKLIRPEEPGAHKTNRK